MSDNQVSNVRQLDNSEYITAKDDNSSSLRIATALATANTGESSNVADKNNDAKNLRKQRQDKLNTTIKQYKLNKEDVLGFIKNVFGYNEDRLYTISNKEFNAIGNLLEAVAEFMIRRSEKHKDKKKPDTKKPAVSW